jgi:hypothetical protein
MQARNKGIVKPLGVIQNVTEAYKDESMPAARLDDHF